MAFRRQAIVRARRHGLPWCCSSRFCRRWPAATTRWADATCGAIRRKLFKIGALVTISVRRIKFAMASGCPYKAIFALAHRVLCAAIDTT